MFICGRLNCFCSSGEELTLRYFENTARFTLRYNVYIIKVLRIRKFNWGDTFTSCKSTINHQLTLKQPYELFGYPALDPGAGFGFRFGLALLLTVACEDRPDLSHTASKSDCSLIKYFPQRPKTPNNTYASVQIDLALRTSPKTVF